MEFFEALFEFLKVIFNALTNFLGRSIPVISDIDSIVLDPDAGDGSDEG